VRAPGKGIVDMDEAKEQESILRVKDEKTRGWASAHQPKISQLLSPLASPQELDMAFQAGVEAAWHAARAVRGCGMAVSALRTEAGDGHSLHGLHLRALRASPAGCSGWPGDVQGRIKPRLQIVDHVGQTDSGHGQSFGNAISICPDRNAALEALDTAIRPSVTR